MRIVIVGPTASGKTGLGIRVANYYNGEVISADSRAVFRGMDIGTAKPTPYEQSEVRHHCLDAVSPDEHFTVADYVAMANRQISNLDERGKASIIVGGSGLFVNALIYGYSFVEPNYAIRAQYSGYNIDQLTEVIVERGYKLPANRKNKRHLLSTLERQGQVGHRRSSTARGATIIGLNPPKNILKERIQMRANNMLNDGIVEEAQALFSKYSTTSSAFNGGIYKLLPDYLNGVITERQLIDRFVVSDMKLVKKQLTWFRRNEEIVWFEDADSAYDWLRAQSLDTIE